jgi:hypothetical protein
MRVLTRAKKQREIRSDADLDSMADFFESTLAGIRMAAKAGKSRHALRNIAAFASTAYGIRSSNNSRVGTLRSLIGGAEATGHEAEAKFQKKTQQHQICPTFARPGIRRAGV